MRQKRDIGQQSQESEDASIRVGILDSIECKELVDGTLTFRYKRQADQIPETFLCINASK
jgi:hypothetical protein